MNASAAFRVCVLEGNYAKMTELGLPLSLAVELQTSNLRLDTSLWTARHTNGGYSVSFFWPSPRCKRRRRRRQRKPSNSRPAISNANNIPCESHFSNMSGPPLRSSRSEPRSEPGLFPSNAHPHKKGDETTTRATSTTTQSVAATNDSDVGPLIPSVMSQQVLKKTPMNLLVSPLGQTVSSILISRFVLT